MATVARAVVALFILFVVYSICSSGNEEPTNTTTAATSAPATTTTDKTTTTTTRPPQTTTTTAQPTTITTLSDAEIAQLAFDVLAATHDVLGGYPLEWLHEVAAATCEAFDAGAGFEVVALAVFAESPADWDLETTGEFIGMATAGFCPEYTWMLEEAADTWG